MKSAMIYLKTTETCNLDCKHCFTSGKNGRKIYWDHCAVIDWIHRLSNEQQYSHVHLEFHGGEPFLAPIETLQEVYNQCKSLWSSQSWGVATNLTFKLTPEIVSFIDGPLGQRVATSWDPDVRFSNPRQYDLWRKNVEYLHNLGFTIKLFVSLTKGTIAMDPLELLKWVRDLGVQELALERLTNNGSARLHPEIFPTNAEVDRWIYEMHLASKKNGCRDWFDNEFLENIYVKFSNNVTNAGTFCRDCEEKLFTLNADGTIGGCPNAAPEQQFGHINDPIDVLLAAPQRIENIAHECSRDPRCYHCPVFRYCGGDCHQLSWDGDTCPAPKTLIAQLAGINTQPKKTFIIKDITHGNIE